MNLTPDLFSFAYEFANETVEIEVDKRWGNILVDLNRQEYNINHKETVFTFQTSGKNIFSYNFYINLAA